MLARLRSFWTPVRVLELVVVLSVVYVTIWSLHPSLVFSSTLVNGGDTGSHLVLPAYLRSQGDLFNLTPWYPGWFAGMPAYTYYFVLPDFLATLASYVINFAVAFKLATVLGSVLMPITAYAMGRLFRAPRPVPAALALATLPFLFDASYTIDGGNLFSSMAGEYSYSFSLALALLTIGLFARGVRTGRGYWLAGLSLSATLAGHVLPFFFCLIAVAVLVVLELAQRRGIGDPKDLDMVRGDYSRPVRFALGAGLLSFGFSAWWLLPFVNFQNLTNSMGYTNDSVANFHAIFTQLGWYNTTGGPGGDRWVIVVGTIAAISAYWTRDRLGMVLGSLALLSLAAFVLDPQSVIWNERLIPYWYISIHLLAGWLVGYVAAWWVRHVPRPKRWQPIYIEGDDIGNEVVVADTVVEPSSLESDEVDLDDDVDEGDRRMRRTMRATIAVAILGLATTVPGQIPQAASALGLTTTGNQVNSWAAWNYSGYQSKPAWPEYHDLMTTMTTVGQEFGCGRAMWEYNSDQNRFGTPMALMLLPYWTNNCIDSMEGLFFESSATTPYHFLNQAELSAAPSNPQVGLAYGSLDVATGVRHLQMLGVKYYIAFSKGAVSQANADPQLRLVASTRAWPAPGATWRIYLIKNSPLVEPLTQLPNVVEGLNSRVGWLDANALWWLNPSLQGIRAASSGPASWPRASSIRSMHSTPPLARVEVSTVRTGNQSVSFHVSRIGVPILVKVSYFPRWHATGATGPYRVSPNLMVVVPTAHDVSMVYGSSPTLIVGNLLSDATAVVGLVVLARALRRRRIAPK